jgi:hypothetical protein
MEVEAEMVLSNGFVAVIDAEDLAGIKRYHWHGRDSCGNIYVARTTSRWSGGIRKVLNIYLHRFLTSAQPGFTVDHLNGDTLDNRKQNLEVVTPEENSRRRWGH